MNTSIIHQQASICALATPQGVGAIALIRLSGHDAISIANSIFRGKDLQQVDSHTVHFGTIRDKEEIVDEVLMTVFKSPRSFTREDAVEIACHGSDYIVRQILKLLVRHGARLANPGEFTQRAFLNGQFDLVQAEAVADLIAADSEASHRTALNQLRGGFSKQLAALREQLIHFASLVELELDFGEEDVEFAERDDLRELIQKLHDVIAPLIESFDFGNALKEGIPVAIIGSPNVGKSTLLNALLNEEKAIVTSIAGTTRDVIEDTLVLGGVKFRIIDTAGIRQTDDVIESMGIERSRNAMEKADVVILLFDSEQTYADVQGLAGEMESEKTVIWVRNKVDLTSLPNPRIAGPALLGGEGGASALEGEGGIFTSPPKPGSPARLSLEERGDKGLSENLRGASTSSPNPFSSEEKGNTTQHEISGEVGLCSDEQCNASSGAVSLPLSSEERGAGGEVISTRFADFESLRNKIPDEVLENARVLRRGATDAEVYFWSLVRNNQLAGLKIRRQYPVKEGFVLDFFCPQYRLGIEIDGGVHQSEEQSGFDEARSQRLKELYGIEVIRFTNEEVLNDTERVLQDILKHVLNKNLLEAGHLAPPGDEADDSATDADGLSRGAVTGADAPQLSILKISAATGLGVAELEERLIQTAQNTIGSQTVVTNMRHYEHLVKTSAALEEVLTGLDSGITGDFLAQDIRLALHHLGEITGQIVTDDLLDNIFSKFCIGK